MLFQNRLLTRAAPIQSHDRKGVVSATNAHHHAVEDLGHCKLLQTIEPVPEPGTQGAVSGPFSEPGN